MRRFAIAACSLVTLTEAALSGEDNFTGSYFCIEMASGGVAFDEEAREWRASRFKPRGGFLLKAQYVSEAEAEISGTKIEKYLYRISIAEQGTQTSHPCWSQAHGELVEVDEKGYLSCTQSLEQMRFSFGTLRYSSYYGIGYVEGKDNNENTPAVTIGKCTKIPV